MIVILMFQGGFIIVELLHGSLISTIVFFTCVVDVT